MHETLCDLMLDLVQNAAEADAMEITLRFHQNDQTTGFEVTDNGRGMDQTEQQRAVDPFYSDGRKHAHRRFGFGLPFLVQTAEAAGGQATITSQPGEGTTVCFRAPSEHVDLPPTGDFAGTAALMMTLVGQAELRIERDLNGSCWSVSRSELAEALGGLESAGNQTLMRTFLRSQEEHVRKAGTEWQN